VRTAQALGAVDLEAGQKDPSLPFPTLLYPPLEAVHPVKPAHQALLVNRRMSQSHMDHNLDPNGQIMKFTAENDFY